MPGQELAQQLTAIRPSLRVVFMSGFARPFLQKPVTEGELLAAVNGCSDEQLVLRRPES